MKRMAIMLLLALLAVTPALAQQSTPMPKAEGQTIAALAAADDNLSMLASALEAADLTTTLDGEGEFTVFAPVNPAFDALPEGALDNLLADPPALNNVLKYHVMDGTYTIEELLELGGFPTLSGIPVTITQVDGTYYINNAAVLTADIPAANGIIHMIDSVLIPPAEAAQEEVLGPKAYFRAAHFVADAGAVDLYLQNEDEIRSVTDLNFANISEFSAVAPGMYILTVTAAGGTLDAPLIEPMEIELAADDLATIAVYGTAANGTISTRVIDESGENLSEGSARLTVFHGIENAPAVNVIANGNLLVEALAFPASLEASDGVFSVDVPAGTYDLQVVSTTDNQVLFDLPGTQIEPDTAYLVTAIGFANASSGQVAIYPTDLTLLNEDEGTVVEAAEQDGRFSTLLIALDAAGLTETLEGDGPFTIFAPTNDAFASLPQMEVDTLLENPAELGDILTYHVVEGVYTAQDLIDMQDDNGMVRLTTVEGEELPIHVQTGQNDVSLSIGNTQFVVTDIEGSNGVLHGIDGVLMPNQMPGMDMAATAVPNS